MAVNCQASLDGVHAAFDELNGVRHAVVEYEQTVEARRDSLIERRTPRRLMLSGFEVVFFVPDQCPASDGSAIVFCQRINVSKPPVGGTVMLALPATIDIEAEITLSGGVHSARRVRNMSINRAPSTVSGSVRRYVYK